MPKDYNLMQGAVSGLAPGKGGKIAGSPGGQQDDSTPGWKFDNDSTLNKHGNLVGSPVGIEVEVRSQASKGRIAAMKRRAG